MTGTWISAALELPKDGVPVLAVKEKANGSRDICIAHCIREFRYHDYETGEEKVKPYWCCGGNNNIIYWMPLPKIPEKEGRK